MHDILHFAFCKLHLQHRNIDMHKFEITFSLSLGTFLVDMVDSMKSVAKMDAELSTEERNLLSVAYKNVIGARRAAWRIVSSMETKAVDEAKSEKHIESMREYKKKIEAELKKICGEIIELLKNLIPRAADAEAKVFFLKM